MVDEWVLWHFEVMRYGKLHVYGWNDQFGPCLEPYIKAV